MVGYDDNSDALTLGDDDVLTVGDYEISYDSGANEWQAEYTPSGDVASVPKNQSGSLFPTDFADALAGEALADDGNLYSSIQTAVDNASSWVFIGPGTFNESVTVTTSGITVSGSGYGTHIDGGTSATALNSNATNVTFQNLSASTTGGGGFDFHRGISLGDNNCTARNAFVRDADDQGLLVSGNDCTVENVVIEACDSNGIMYNGASRGIVTGCKVLGGTSGDGIYLRDNSDDTIVSNCVVNSVTGHGIKEESAAGSVDDIIIIGNRVINSGQNGIYLEASVDSIIANNRISDSAGSDIQDNGTGTVLDGNLTGASN
jgi:parallel beta-helix repeat protein